MPYDAQPHPATSELEDLETLAARILPAQSPNRELYREMLTTVLRLARADRSRWEAKIVLQTLREMEHAFARLQRFAGRHKVTVFGSARTPVEDPLYEMARQLGEHLADHDLMVITGAGGGIMSAAHLGAGREHSLGFNITLPFEQHANATVDGSDHLLSFHFFFVRKLFFVKEAAALVLFPGGFGTLDETLEVLTLIQTGKSPLVPVVLIDAPGGTYWSDLLRFLESQLRANRYILPADLRLMRQVASPQAALEEITGFYANYHSSRWQQGRFLIRLRHRLNDTALATLEREFASLCLGGGFEQRPGEESGELAGLTHLEFAFNGRDQGRLRELLDVVNASHHWA